MNQRRTKSGFTLGELLVVIAIIAVMSAILFPVFARQRDQERTKETTCMSNIKQIGIGMREYAEDYDEQYAPGINSNHTGNGWAGQIYPYIQRVTPFVCPSDSTVPSKDAHFTSYGLNSQLLDAGQTGYSNTDFTDRSKTVLIFEVTNSNGYTISRPTLAPSKDSGYVVGDDYLPDSGGSAAGFGVGGADDPSGFNSNSGTPGGTSSTLKYATGPLVNMRSGNASGDFASGRHNDGANYGMADGRAVFLLPSNVSGGYPNDAASETDCGGHDPDNPKAAQADCPDKTIKATFNIE